MDVFLCIYFCRDEYHVLLLYTKIFFCIVIMYPCTLGGGF